MPEPFDTYIPYKYTILFKSLNENTGKLRPITSTLLSIDEDGDILSNVVDGYSLLSEDGKTEILNTIEYNYDIVIKNERNKFVDILSVFYVENPTSSLSDASLVYEKEISVNENPIEDEEDIGLSDLLSNYNDEDEFIKQTDIDITLPEEIELSTITGNNDIPNDLTAYIDSSNDNVIDSLSLDLENELHDFLEDNTPPPKQPLLELEIEHSGLSVSQLPFTTWADNWVNNKWWYNGTWNELCSTVTLTLDSNQFYSFRDNHTFTNPSSPAGGRVYNEIVDSSYNQYPQTAFGGKQVLFNIPSFYEDRIINIYNRTQGWNYNSISYDPYSFGLSMKLSQQDSDELPILEIVEVPKNPTNTYLPEFTIVPLSVSWSHLIKDTIIKVNDYINIKVLQRKDLPSQEEQNQETEENK